jgi:hypothetical protein
MFIVTPIFGSTNLYIFIILEHVPICIRVLLGLHIFIIVTPIFWHVPICIRVLLGLHITTSCMMR